MTITLNSHVVSDLCLGKPPLKPLPASASVADALAALRASDDCYISLWTCEQRRHVECRCVGKVCMGDILCFLCKQENLGSSVSHLLHSPLSLLLPKLSGLVKHVDPTTSLLEAIGLILQGAHHLVVPIQSTRKHQKPFSTTAAAAATTSHGGQEYCWLTQEDLIRFILSRIGLFTPIPAYTIQELGIIRTETLAVDYHSPASLAPHLLSQSLTNQTSLAVIDEADGTLVGEISPASLVEADETAAAAFMALSCGDLMAYIDSWGGPPDDLVRVVKERLKESHLEGLLALFDDDCSSSSAASFSSSSDDEDSVSCLSSPCGPLRRHNRSWSYSGRTGWRVQEITCHPGSSLVAVMVQAIAHRASYVWVVECDNSLAGIVTFSDMLRVFYEYLQSMLEEE